MSDQQAVVKTFIPPREASLQGKDLSELLNLARQAFERKRQKDCLILTRTILKIDPNHKEALEINSWVESGLHQNLAEARAIVDEARLRGDTALYRRAEIVLRRI